LRIFKIYGEYHLEIVDIRKRLYPPRWRGLAVHAPKNKEVGR